MTMREILYRDWPGLLVSSITLGLFVMSTYLVAITQLAVVDLKAENKSMIVEMSHIRLHLEELHQRMGEK